jgi:hypothetical protein
MAETRTLYGRFLSKAELLLDACEAAGDVKAEPDLADVLRLQEATRVPEIGKEVALLRAEMTVLAGNGLGTQASEYISACYEIAKDNTEANRDAALERLVKLADWLHRDATSLARTTG